MTHPKGAKAAKSCIEVASMKHMTTEYSSTSISKMALSHEIIAVESFAARLVDTPSDAQLPLSYSLLPLFEE